MAIVTAKPDGFKQIVHGTDDSWVIETFTNFSDYRKSLEIGRTYDKTLLTLNNVFKDTSTIAKDIISLNNNYGQVIIFISGDKQQQVKLAKYLVTSINASKIGCLVVQGKFNQNHIIDAVYNDARDVNIKSGLIKDEKDFISSLIETATPEEEETKETEINRNKININPQKATQPKKKGFFSKLFGSHTPQNENSVPQTQNVVPTNETANNNMNNEEVGENGKLPENTDNTVYETGNTNNSVDNTNYSSEQYSDENQTINSDDSVLNENEISAEFSSEYSNSENSKVPDNAFSEGNLFSDSISANADTVDDYEKDTDWDNAQNDTTQFSNMFTKGNLFAEPVDESEAVTDNAEVKTEVVVPPVEEKVETVVSPVIPSVEEVAIPPVVSPVMVEEEEAVATEDENEVTYFAPEDATSDEDLSCTFDNSSEIIGENIDINPNFMSAMTNLVANGNNANSQNDNSVEDATNSEDLGDEFTEVTEVAEEAPITESPTEESPVVEPSIVETPIVESSISPTVANTQTYVPPVREEHKDVVPTDFTPTYTGDRVSITQTHINEDVAPKVINSIEFSSVEVPTSIQLDSFGGTAQEYVEPVVPTVESNVELPTFSVVKPEITAEITEGTVIDTGVSAIDVDLPDLSDLTPVGSDINLDDFDFNLDLEGLNDETETSVDNSSSDLSDATNYEEATKPPVVQATEQSKEEPQQKKKKGLFNFGKKKKNEQPTEQPKPQPVKQSDNEVVEQPVIEDGEVKEEQPFTSSFADLGGLDITELEQDYKEVEQQSRVQIKEIRVNSQLENIIRGRGHKVVYVVGNGNTTDVAYNLAKFMSQHCRVLYVDADTRYHGILSKIDYLKVVDYESMKLTGFSLSLNDVAFHNNIIKSFEANLDILLDDYFTKYRKEDAIENALSVILDNALIDYSFAVIDLPFYNLEKAESIIGTGIPIFVANSTRRGYSDFTADFVNIGLKQRYLKMMLGSGTIVPVYNGNNEKEIVDLKKLHKDLDIFNLDEHEDWLSMKTTKVNPTAEEIVNALFES